MANDSTPKRSFSAGQRWGIFFSVLISIVAVLALVVMINYLGARYYLRFPWSRQSRTVLSPQTIGVLKSVTNDINVVVFYDKKNVLYDYIKDLLDEYKAINPKISVKTVDYLINHADAIKISDAYRDFMGPGTDTNVVIFSCSKGTNIIPGEMLGHFVMESVPNENEREFRNKLKSFDGELAFSAIIYHLVSDKPKRAYFLEGLKSQHHLEDQDKFGYLKFKSVLAANNIETVSVTSLKGTNGVPGDCKLLIIADPGRLDRSEIENIRKYLEQGGRLFVLFGYLGQIETGLEAVLMDWGVRVGWNVYVKDPKNSTTQEQSDIIIYEFNKTHPAVTHLSRFRPLQMVLPRPVVVNSNQPGFDVSALQELAWTGREARVNDSPVPASRPVPLIAAVEKASVKGITERATTRILVTGDSFFLDNESIDSGPGGNRAFAGYAVNWLLGQMELLQGVGPREITEYKLRMTAAQLQSIRWIFLAAMPGGILLFGGLVWLRRRH